VGADKSGVEGGEWKISVYFPAKINDGESAKAVLLWSGMTDLSRTRWLSIQTIDLNRICM
jgi:hypothetical protein